ncbi:phosphatase PAP2 family protein [Pseudobutyrivibrio xylanivorans]|uniref:PAP2 superfamily protein n=1 Tax=Pseudobutyrivibrio xylanivorans TaxID=185007 RepID=A0A1G5RVL8_PSEXY|nr:phosphatase PAP2 family protein [Pseudobutyrivibrio xylanivorans]SCZ77491.1 PAP2 superfamily protein [Pseudobutyrivibrio xylanivorans]
MGEQKSGIKAVVWNSLLWIIVFAVGMLIFTFYDLPIAKEVYSIDSAYGRFFEIIGLITTPMAGIFFAISNFLTLRVARKRILSIILGWLALIVFVGFNLLSVGMLNSRWLGVIFLCDLLFIRFSMLANRYICSHAQVVELRKVMMVGLVATLVAVLGQTIIKYGFNRPRFITLTDPDTQFTYWFVHHPIAHDSSFPSGHAAQSALSFMLVFLKKFLPKLRTPKWDIALWAVAIFITLSTMISRMLLGVHYATDVWAGCFLTLFTISLTNWYVEKTYKA